MKHFGNVNQKRGPRLHFSLLPQLHLQITTERKIKDCLYSLVMVWKEMY